MDDCGLNQDIVGIYRLCGATTKKNILRLAFEESPDIVDLSSMNVPDINVITSESTGLSKKVSAMLRELTTMLRASSCNLVNTFSDNPVLVHGCQLLLA